MIDKEHYNSWRNHPATLFFRKFLMELAERMRARRNEIVEGNQHLDPSLISALAEVRGRILMLEEVSDVPFEQIADFYGIEEKADDGTKNAG